MLSVILACDDPYATASLMTDTLGWELEFATPRDSDDNLACVRLGDAEIMLGVADEQYLPASSRSHRGAGVEIYVRLPATTDIADMHARHAEAGVVTHPLTRRPWGESAFNAVIAGYKFLITQEPVDDAVSAPARPASSADEVEAVEEAEAADAAEAVAEPRAS